MAEAGRRVAGADRVRRSNGSSPRLRDTGHATAPQTRRSGFPDCRHLTAPGTNCRTPDGRFNAHRRRGWAAGGWFVAIVAGAVLSPGTTEMARAAREVSADAAVPATATAETVGQIRADVGATRDAFPASAAGGTAFAPGAWRNALSAALMGVVEGLTEFLPVSSTGHLILVGHFLNYGSPAFEIVIQLGAMFALTWCTRERLLLLAGGLLRDAGARALALRLVIAFLPAALAGFALGDFVESHLFRPEFVAAMLVAGGIILLVIDSPDRRGHTHAMEEITLLQALAIGCGQTVALLPGVSRSGATIVSGLVAGLDRRVATEFSFLLALPTMYAAGGYTLLRAHDTLAAELGAGTLIGLVTAYVAALMVIRAFLRFVETNTLRPFGWYRIAAGLGIGAVFLCGS